MIFKNINFKPVQLSKVEKKKPVNQIQSQDQNQEKTLIQKIKEDMIIYKDRIFYMIPYEDHSKEGIISRTETSSQNLTIEEAILLYKILLDKEIFVQIALKHIGKTKKKFSNTFIKGNIISPYYKMSVSSAGTILSLQADIDKNTFIWRHEYALLSDGIEYPISIGLFSKLYNAHNWKKEKSTKK